MEQMGLRTAWIDHCIELSTRKADFYSGCRKILRARKITFPTLTGDLELADAGYTKTKLSYLRRGYLHEESRAVAQQLWQRRLDQDKYGSVGFTTYNHFIKNDPNKKSKRASVMGPCIQSVVLTLLPKRNVAIDVFYRTTEFFKKFPADLVFLRDELLEGFDLYTWSSTRDKPVKIQEVNCHFANITMHPMYFITVLPSIDQPLKAMELIRKSDKYFFDWIVKWSARYICDEYHRGIEKFSQAMRVRKDAYGRLDKRTLRELQAYFRKHHPGYRNGDYTDPDEEETE